MATNQAKIAFQGQKKGAKRNEYQFKTNFLFVSFKYVLSIDFNDMLHMTFFIK